MDQHLQVGLQYAPRRPQIHQASQPQQFPMPSQTQQSSSQATVRLQAPPTYPQIPHWSHILTACQCKFHTRILLQAGRPSFSGTVGRATQLQTLLRPLLYRAILRPKSTKVHLEHWLVMLVTQEVHPSLSHSHVYETDGSWPPIRQPHFQQSGYPPTHVAALPNQPLTPAAGLGARHPSSQTMRNHPYGEMIEKAASMGYQREQARNAIQRMEESGQPVDFNSLFDMLNARY